MYKSSLFVVLIATILSCSSNKESENLTFQSSIQLKTKLLIGSSELLDPWDIDILDSTLIIANQKGEPVVHLYSTKGEKIKETLSRGKGPSEILMEGAMWVDHAERSFSLYDLFGKKIVKFHLNKLIKNQDYFPELVMDFSKSTESSVLFDKIIMGENLFIGESSSPRGRIVLLTPKGELVDYYLKFPAKGLIDPNMSEIANAHLYAMGLSLSPNKKKLAIATYSAGMLDLIDLSAGKVDSIWADHSFIPSNIKLVKFGDKEQPAFTPESINGYPDIYATDKFAYAIFSGQKFDSPNSHFGNVIRVVSWDGKKKIEIILDKKIKRLAVANEDDRIYAIAINENAEPEILEIDIENVLQ